jgi:hypothetical protein
VVTGRVHSTDYILREIYISYTDYYDVFLADLRPPQSIIIHGSKLYSYSGGQVTRIEAGSATIEDEHEDMKTPGILYELRMNSQVNVA